MTNNKVLSPGDNIRPQITLEEAKNLVEELYGFHCKSITQLDGYDDKNFKITTAENHVDNNEYVLKILNSLDSRNTDFIEAQNELLLYLDNSNISCPHPVMTTDGKFYSIQQLQSGKHIIRLMKFIPGTLLHKATEVTANLMTHIGTFVAKLDTVLEKFNHPAYASHQTLWMLESLPYLKEFVFAIDDDNKKKIILDIIEEFEEQVLIKKDQLNKGMIHGDCNEQNILVEKIGEEWQMKSILDFGDSQYSCYLFELAITMAYIMILKKDLDAGSYVLEGYCKVRKISEDELDLLKICIEARLCQSLVMGAYSSKQDPGNAYLLVTSKPGWELLSKLRSTRKEDLLSKWKLLSSERWLIE